MRKDVWDAYSMSVLTVHIETAPEMYFWHDRQVGHQIRKARRPVRLWHLHVFGFVFSTRMITLLLVLANNQGLCLKKREGGWGSRQKSVVTMGIIRLLAVIRPVRVWKPAFCFKNIKACKSCLDLIERDTWCSRQFHAIPVSVECVLSCDNLWVFSSSKFTVSMCGWIGMCFAAKSTATPQQRQPRCLTNPWTERTWFASHHSTR